MYRFIFFLKDILLQIFPTVRGRMNSSLQQSRNFSMYSKGAWSNWHILAYTKGELTQRFQQVLRGSMDRGMFIKEREYLGLPFALDVKGGERFGVFAIKSKGGDCWHYDACVVLDGNPLVEEQLTYI